MDARAGVRGGDRARRDSLRRTGRDVTWSIALGPADQSIPIANAGADRRRVPVADAR